MAPGSNAPRAPQDRRRPARLGQGQRWRDDLAVGAAMALLALGLALGEWAWRLDRLWYDATLAFWPRPAPADIVIVAIDDASVDAIGRWPWRRAVHATLLHRIGEAHPRALLLDLVLSEPDPDPAQDALLAQALQAASPAVLPVALVARPDAPGGIGVLEPVPALREVAALGAAESAVDADGVLRHAFLRAGPAGSTYPHLALALLNAGGESPHPALRTDLAPAVAAVAGRAGTRGGERDGRFLIRYAGAPGHFERISYVELLAGRVPAQRLAGRYVLLGMTAQGLGDTLATPVNARHEAMPGVEVLANTLHTLRSGDTLSAVAPDRIAFVAALALLVLPALLSRLPPRGALPVVAGAALAVVLASALALDAGWWFSPWAFALPALLSYPLWSWRRLERAMRVLGREIARVADAAGGAPLERRRSARPAPAVDTLDARLDTLQRAGAWMREARRFLADALAALPTAVLVAGAGGRVELANAHAAALFEVGSADEMQGLDLARLLAECRSEAALDWPQALAAVRAGAPPLAVEVQMADGGSQVVHLAAVDLMGAPRWVVTIADVAPVKQAERQREEALAFVSHDLRSPASSIALLARLQQGDAPPMEAAEFAREAERLARRTLAMSEAFVRTAQVETRPLARRRCAPATLVDEALADLRAQALAAGVRIEADAAGAPDAVEVDVELVVRALANLVGNALRHSPRGGVLRVRAEADGAQLRLSVDDEGPGLAPDQLAQLAAGGAVRVGHAQGMGLGLLFAQRVAQRHGGRLEAASPAGGGARFTLMLPGVPQA